MTFKSITIVTKHNVSSHPDYSDYIFKMVINSNGEYTYSYLYQNDTKYSVKNRVLSRSDFADILRILDSDEYSNLRLGKESDLEFYSKLSFEEWNYTTEKSGYVSEELNNMLLNKIKSLCPNPSQVLQDWVNNQVTEV